MNLSRWLAGEESSLLATGPGTAAGNRVQEKLARLKQLLEEEASLLKEGGPDSGEVPEKDAQESAT